jgi:CubicO group peptidase (beta-lactamase class C family)
MNKEILAALCLAAALSLQAACAAPRPASPTAPGIAVPARPNPAASPADLARFAEEVLAEAGVRDWAVALIRDGRVMERRFSRGGDGIGHAVDGATTFDLASIAKPVMAWGVMGLVEAGRVDLDRPIESYLTRWRLPPSAFDHREVTVRRVLSHTAGLTATSSLLPAPDGARPPIEWFLEGRRLQVGLEPGTRYNYSGGYDLLELLIEEASGRDFSRFMTDEVLRPLGMDRTVFGLVQPDDTPLPRTNVLGGDVRDESSIFSSSGHLVGNLDELTAFALAHLEDGPEAPRGRGVLQPATLDTMLTPTVDASSGFGYVLRHPRPDLLTAGHAGAGASLFRVAPATGDGLVILTNHGPGYAAIARIECVWLAWLAKAERRCPVQASYALMGAYQRSGVQGALDYYRALADHGGPDYEVGLASLSEFARMLLAAGRLDDAASAYRLMAGAGSDETAAYRDVADRLVAGFQPQADRLACYVGEYRSSAGGALRLERAGEGVTFTMIEPVPGLTGPLRPLSERVWVMRAGDEYPIELIFDMAPSGVATRVAVWVNDYRIAFSAERTGAGPNPDTCGSSGNRLTVPGIRPPVLDGSDRIRSRFFHSDGRRLHYLDFGGEGLPLVFVPSLDRTADAFRGFAPRFTDRQRVLAITNRGSGQSQGETRDQWDTAGRARDVVALLDTLGIQHAVVVGRGEDVPIYLAENHAERVAGLVILSPQEIGPSRRTLRAQDPTGVVGMVDRWALTAVWGFDPDQPAPWDDAYAPRYFQSDAVIGIPTLAFRGAESRGRGAADLSLPLGLAELADADPERFPDAVSRSWFQRLRADSTLQSEVRAFYENVVDPAFAASERAFLEAFSDHLRIVRLDLEEPITGYEYQDHAELFEAHIRRFLEEISTGQRVGAGESRSFCLFARCKKLEGTT